MSCASLSSLTVLDRDGFVKPVAGASSNVIKGDVELRGGNDFGVAWDESSGSLVIGVDGSGGGDDPVYKAKWLDLVNGGGGFSGLPYYVSSVNDAKPKADGTLFLLGGLCPQLGLFDDEGEDYRRPSRTPHALEFFDMCEACVDCADYQKLFEYVDRIKEWLDANKDNNLTTGLQLFKQYQATVHYWNYLVHVQSIPFTVYANGDDVGVKVGYRCLDCGPFHDIMIQVHAEELGGDSPTSSTWSVVGINKQPNTLSVSVFATEDESQPPSDSYESDTAVVVIDAIDKTEYVIVDLTLANEPPAGGMTTEFRITATWFDTHLGAVVTRHKDITVSTPTS